MVSLLGKFFKEKYSPDSVIIAGLPDLNNIRNNIINSIYLISGILGIVPVIISTMRIYKVGFNPFIIFQFILFISVWYVYFLRHRFSSKIKAVIFLAMFFILATIINVVNGLVSGALNFILITTLTTLLFGWKLGVLSVFLTLIVRGTIGFLYYKKILTYHSDLNIVVNAIPTLATAIGGAVVIASIILYSIYQLYRWLVISLTSATQKANELSVINKELENARQDADNNIKLKTLFLANISHEIRTPMNAIVGFSGLLSKPNLTEVSRNKYTNLIQQRSLDLMRIIDDIIDMSKIEVGQMSLAYSDFKVYPVFIEIREYYLLKLKTANEVGIEFKTDFPEELKELSIHSDLQRFKQLITNLLDNALKFTHKGHIELGCKLTTPENLLVWISDTGIGIESNKQELIFDQFRQAEDFVTAREYGGTGLGLSIVKGIIELMKGNLWLDSEPGKGSTFYFVIPVSPR